MIAASLHNKQSHPTVRWVSCRNVLMGLVGLQTLILVYIGFSAPSVHEHHLNSIMPGAIKPQNNGVDHGAGNNKAQAEEIQSKVWKDVSANNNKDLLASLDMAGPFDIPGAYFGNFQLARDRPEFRTVAVPGEDKWKQLEQDAIASVQQTVKSCTYYEQARMLTRPECRATGASLVAYNPSTSKSKIRCGTSIAPKSFAAMPSGACDEPVRLREGEGAPVSGKDMPPVQFIRKDLESQAPQRLDTCDIPCEVTMCGTTGECLPDVSDWTIGGTDWKFKFYHKVPGLKVDRKAYRSFSFSASQSFASDVPLSTFDWSLDSGTPPPPVDFDTAAKSISLISTDTCRGLIRTEAWALSMSSKHELASYGKCVHNTEVPAGLSLNNKEDRQTLMKKHLFTLVVEPSLENDFISELLWEALHAGVIPVYYGAGNILDHVPPGSVLNAAAVGSKDGTAELVKEISNDRSKWEAYHAWRKQPYPEKLKEKFEFLKTDPFCRVCKWAYAKKHGLGWNHKNQTIQEPVISRSPVCTSDNGFLMRPFRETWYSSLIPDAKKTLGADGDCHEVGLKQTIQGDDNTFTVTRTISPHDTIVDIIIPEIESRVDGEVVLRLEVPIDNWEGANFINVHRLIPSQHVAIFSSIAIQDKKSRMTVLTNWQTQLRCLFTHGVVEIVVQEAGEETILANEIRSIRVIVEDTSDLRDVMTEYGHSPFAKPLIEDFLDPLELLYVES